MSLDYWKQVINQRGNTVKEGEYRILSIDGGGIKGLFPATFLRCIEEKVEGRISDYFDLIVGTSTGGIISLGLASESISTHDICKFYNHYGYKVFNQSLRWPLGKVLPKGMIYSKYKSDNLKEVLKGIFKDSKISDLKTAVCIPSVESKTAKTRTIKTPHKDLDNEYKNLHLWDVAMATSAAPYFFPAHRGELDANLIDGGLWANNPSMVGIVEALSMGYKLDQIKVLSIGTGYKAINLSDKRSGLGGILSWRKDLVTHVMATQILANTGSAKRLLKEEQYFRLDREGNFEDMDIVSAKSLQYLRAQGIKMFKEEFDEGRMIRKNFFE